MKLPLSLGSQATQTNQPNHAHNIVYNLTCSYSWQLGSLSQQRNHFTSNNFNLSLKCPKLFSWSAEMMVALLVVPPQQLFLLAE